MTKHISYSIEKQKSIIKPFTLVFHNISTNKSFVGGHYSTRKKAIELCDRRFEFLNSKSWPFKKFAEFDVDSDLGFFCDKCCDYESSQNMAEHDGGATWLCRDCDDEKCQSESVDDGVDWNRVDAAVFQSQEARHQEKNC